MAAPAGWRAVTRRETCPICGHGDNCKVANRADGGTAVWCARVSEGSSKTNLGGQHLHIIGGDSETPRPAPRPEISKPPKPGADLSALAKYYQLNLDDDRLATLAANLGVTPASLRAIGAGFGSRTETSSSAYVFPEKDATGRVVGFLNRYLNGTKRLAAGGSRGLYYAGDLMAGHGDALLVEGASDTAALNSIGISAIGRPSCTGGVEHLIELLIDFPLTRKIVVVGEWDQKPHDTLKPDQKRRHKPDCECCSTCWPGKFGAMHTARQLSDALERDVYWTLPPDGAKDARAWLKGFNDEDPQILARAFMRGLDLHVVAAPVEIDIGELPPGEESLTEWREGMLQARIAVLKSPGHYLDESSTGAGKTSVFQQMCEFAISLHGGATNAA